MRFSQPDSYYRRWLAVSFIFLMASSSGFNEGLEQSLLQKTFFSLLRKLKRVRVRHCL